MEWTIDHRTGQAYATVATRGVFRLDDHLRMIEDIVSRDFWRPGMAVLFDHRQLDFGDSGLWVMRQAAENHLARDTSIGDGKAAILMKSAADYGRGRQFEMVADGQVGARMQVFLDEVRALRWLLED